MFHTHEKMIYKKRALWMLSIEYRVADRRWVSKTWNAYGIKWMCGTPHLHNAENVDFIIDTVYGAHTFTPKMWNDAIRSINIVTYANEVENLEIFNISVNMLNTIHTIEFNLYCYAFYYGRNNGKSIGKYIGKRCLCLDFDFDAIDIKFPSNYVFIIWVVLGSFMARWQYSSVRLSPYFVQYSSLCSENIKHSMPFGS